MINKIFYYKNNWFLTILFFPIIYALGWIITTLLIRIYPDIFLNKSLFGTLITIIIFLVTLPLWSKLRWGKKLSHSIGDININNPFLFFRLIFELSKAFFIICIIINVLVFTGFAELINNITINLIFDSLFIGFIVGIAEELVFRLWLYEELILFFTTKNANLLQAIIFAVIHLRWNLNLFSNVQLFLGLFLLGIYLNTWRIRKYPSILFAILFHGGLVGFWYLLNNGFLFIQKNVPNFLFGPGESNDMNPIGGLLGILILFILIYEKFPAFAKVLFDKGRTLRDSSSDDFP